jgi:hypothetical protein
VATKRDKRLQEVSDDVRAKQTRDRTVNSRWRGQSWAALKWIALRLLEGGLPVIGKAAAGGAVVFLARWWLGE